MAEVLDCRIGVELASRIVGVKYRTLDSWIRTGLLTVTRAARGTGSRREFSFLDLIRARCVNHMRQAGVSLQTIRQVQAQLIERYGVQDPLTQPGKLIIAGGNDVHWETDDNKLLNVLKGQYAARSLVILDMPVLAQETHQKMLEVCRAAA